MFIKVLFLLLTVAYKTTAVHYGEIEIECENDTCTKCYKTLATELLKNADNYIALQSTFFPPDNSGPDFVIVTYVFDEQYNLNETESTASQNLSNHIWFWSSSAYFFYHPLRVIQFTSLGFSDPYLKQRSISLRLPASCYYSESNADPGPFNMKLLTQRLQLFARHQKITGQIDSTYTAQSHSLETLRDWHMQNSYVSKLVLSSQCIFPVFASIFLVLYFAYLIEFEPINFGKKLNSQANAKSPEIKTAAVSKVWIIVTISILFTIGTIGTDIAAIVEYSYLPKEIDRYIKDSSKAFTYLRAIPFIMLAFDVLSLLLYIIVPSIVACCKCMCTEENCKDSCCKCYKCEQYKLQVSDYLYTLLSPLSCIATHSYHIIFAFINNPYHATSVLLFYTMTLFVVVVIFQKTYYFVHALNKKIMPVGDDEANDQCGKGHGKRCVLVFSFIAVIVALTICIGLTVAVLIALPINNAIDLASTEIYAIYQASVTVFAALVTFQVVFRPTNSIFAVFIKAADERGSKKQENWEKWEKMSEKEKEIHLGDVLLSHIDFKPPESSISTSSTVAQNPSQTTSQNPSHASSITSKLSQSSNKGNRSHVSTGSSVSAPALATPSGTSRTSELPPPLHEVQEPQDAVPPTSEQPPDDEVQASHVPTGSSVSAEAQEPQDVMLPGSSVPAEVSSTTQPDPPRTSPLPGSKQSPNGAPHVPTGSAAPLNQPHAPQLTSKNTSQSPNHQQPQLEVNNSDLDNNPIEMGDIASKRRTTY